MKEVLQKVDTIIHKSDKYDSEYWVDNDGDLFYRPITTDGSVEEWSEVSEEAFSESERKEFDKEMKKLFGKKIKFVKGGDLNTYGREMSRLQKKWDNYRKECRFSICNDR